MKKLFILVAGFCLIFSLGTEAQCKWKKFPKNYLKMIRSDDCSVKPDIATEIRKTLYGFSTASVVSFVKSGEEYYLYFYITRSSSSKFGFEKNNSLELFFNDGAHLALYPCGTFTAKSLPLLDCNIAGFYSVTREQLKQIAEGGRLKSFILHISADKTISSAQVDEDGSMFFEYEISSDKLGHNLSEIADCMLSK